MTKNDTLAVFPTLKHLRLFHVLVYKFAQCIDKQRQRAETRGIGFQLMVPEHLRVHANRDAMIHIVGNLVENAGKYNRDDGLVTIRAEQRREPNKVLLEVIDLGIGMAPSHLERIFERFFRVDSRS